MGGWIDKSLDGFIDIIDWLDACYFGADLGAAEGRRGEEPLGAKREVGLEAGHQQCRCEPSRAGVVVLLQGGLLVEVGQEVGAARERFKR